MVHLFFNVVKCTNLNILQTSYGSGDGRPPDLIRPVLWRRRRVGGHDVGPLVSPGAGVGAAAATDPRDLLVRAELVAVAQSLQSHLRLRSRRFSENYS